MSPRVLIVLAAAGVMVFGTGMIIWVVVRPGGTTAATSGLSEAQREHRKALFQRRSRSRCARRAGDEAAMVNTRPFRGLQATFIVIAILAFVTAPALAQQGAVLTALENQVVTAAKGWETTIMKAARSLFWILAGIEIGVAAIWLAISAASLDSWFAELVRRIMFIGLFAFILDGGPAFAKAVVDSLYQIGAGGGSPSPANIFDAGIRVASKMSEQAKFGLFEDNALAIAAVFAMVVVVVSFSLVAAIFVAVVVEMYVGLLAGMIMLGLGGSSYTKDFAIRYLVYAFSVGMKLMALVMIAKIGSETLLGLAEAPTATSDQFITTLAVAGISVVVFVIAMYVPPIMQGVVQGVSVTGGMESIRHSSQASGFAIGATVGTTSLAIGGAKVGTAAYADARSTGSSMTGATLKGMASGFGAVGGALASAARDQAMGGRGTYGTSTLGLANAKLEEVRKSSLAPKGSSGKKGQ